MTYSSASSGSLRTWAYIAKATSWRPSRDNSSALSSNISAAERSNAIITLSRTERIRAINFPLVKTPPSPFYFTSTLTYSKVVECMKIATSNPSHPPPSPPHTLPPPPSHPPPSPLTPSHPHPPSCGRELMCSAATYCREERRNLSSLVLSTPRSPGSSPALARCRPGNQRGGHAHITIIQY